MSKTMMTSIKFWSVVPLAALALSACNSKAPERQDDPEVSASDEAEEQLAEPKSIIRPDAEINREAAPIEPISLRIPFGDGQPELSADALEALKAVMGSRQMEAGGPIVLSGHTDSKGTDTANLRVSQQRAELVRDWLLERKVSASRITVVALGEQNPERGNANPDGTANEENRAYNRRVMLDIALPAEMAGKDAAEVQTLVEQVTSED